MKHLNAIIATQAGPGYSIAQEGIADKLKEGFLYLRNKFNPKTKEELEAELGARLEIVQKERKSVTEMKAKLGAVKASGTMKVNLTKGLAPLGFSGKTPEDVVAFINEKTAEIKAGKEPKEAARTEGSIVMEINKAQAMAVVTAFENYMKACESVLDQAYRRAKKPMPQMEAEGGFLSALVDVLLIPIKAIWFLFRCVFFFNVVVITLCTLWFPAVLVLTGNFGKFYDSFFDVMFPEYKVEEKQTAH